MNYDIAVIGGGIIGLSVAMQAADKFPRLRIVVIEKESGVARHQSGHNSGVIHSGIYYKPGSLKAKLCMSGAKEMIEFCINHEIPHEVCGKLIVATTLDEASRLDEFLTRGQSNGLDGLRILERGEMREMEPHVGGLRALYVSSTGITNYAMVAMRYAEVAASRGVGIMTDAEVLGFDRDVVQTSAGDVSARFVINCAGLYSDRIARMAGDDPEVIIAPFRGEYYDLAPARQSLVRNLIYPLPDPRYPFLGVHFTRRIQGNIDAGPNAVLAFRREGYHFTDFNLAETLEVLSDSGFRTMAKQHWRNGLAEFHRSLRKSLFVKSCQRLVPEVRMEDMSPGVSGVRAQAIAANGTLVDDFKFVVRERFLHVLNVPSPAATASLPIGREILKMIPTDISAPRTSQRS